MSEGESTGRVKVSHTCRKWSVFGELADSTEDELAARRSLLSADPPTGSAGQRARPSGRNRICIHLCVRQPMRTVVVVVIVISPLVIIAGSSPSSGSGRSAARTGLRRVAAAVRRNCNLAPPPPLESPLSHAVMCARASWLARRRLSVCPFVRHARARADRAPSVRPSVSRPSRRRALRSAHMCARATSHRRAQQTSAAAAMQERRNGRRDCNCPRLWAPPTNTLWAPANARISGAVASGRLEVLASASRPRVFNQIMSRRASNWINSSSLFALLRPNDQRRRKWLSANSHWPECCLLACAKVGRRI